MKPVHTALAARYLVALRTHLGRQKHGGGNHARNLGRAALKAGLVTLDLAIMHEQAVVALAPQHDFARTQNGTLKRAGLFFTDAIAPIESAQRSSHDRALRLQRRHDSLRLQTTALARAKLRLEQEMKRRKAGEEVIRRGKEQYEKLFFESQLMQKKLRLLTRQIILAQEEERKEISRELHDEVVQTLVGINVELAALSKGMTTGTQTLRAKITRTQRLVENSVKAVHRFARELRPAVLDDLGLIPALHAYSKSLAARKKIRIQLTAYHGVEKLGSTARTALFRVAQEALTNVIRHAQATEIRLHITKIPHAIRMEIGDDGRSFEVDKVLQTRTQKRLGLIGMKERIEMIGGSFAIESALGRGTRVCAEVPFIDEKEQTKK